MHKAAVAACLIILLFLGNVRGGVLFPIAYYSFNKQSAPDCTENKMVFNLSTFAQD